MDSIDKCIEKYIETIFQNLNAINFNLKAVANEIGHANEDDNYNVVRDNLIFIGNSFFCQAANWKEFTLDNVSSEDTARNAFGLRLIDIYREVKACATHIREIMEYIWNIFLNPSEIIKKLEEIVDIFAEKLFIPKFAQ